MSFCKSKASCTNTNKIETGLASNQKAVEFKADMRTKPIETDVASDEKAVQSEAYIKTKPIETKVACDEKALKFEADLRLNKARSLIRNVKPEMFCHYHSKMTAKMDAFWQCRSWQKPQVYEYHEKWSSPGVPNVFISYSGGFANHEKWEYDIPYSRLQGWTVFDGLYSLGRSTVWIDKVCMDQHEEELNKLKVYDYLFAENLTLCKYFFVILHDGYFVRLWALVEWTNAIWRKDATEILVGLTPFIDMANNGKKYFASLMSSVANISIKNAQCAVESDRSVLIGAVNAKFRSMEAFERFAKVTALCFIARTINRNQYYCTTFLPMIIETAESIKGLDGVVEVLKSADKKRPKGKKGWLEWWDPNASQGKDPRGENYKWFMKECVQLIRDEQRKALQRIVV